MANTKAAKKEIRVAEARKERNKTARSYTKTVVHKVENLVADGQLESAKVEVASALSALDRSVGKGIAHANNAARHKSRLAKKLNKASAAKTA